MGPLQLQKKLNDLEHLDRLKTLTGKLPPVPSLEDFVKRETSCVELEANIGGPILLFYCYKGENIAVARTFASAGTVMETHKHEEKFILIVYRGAIELIFIGEDVPKNLQNGGNKHILRASESFEILPGMAHKLHWLEDSWSLTITIPPAKGLPNACRSK